MIYFALGCAALAFFVWLGRGRRFDIGSGWRIGAGVMALAAFAGAAFVTMRGLWGTGIVLAVVGLGFLASARRKAMGAPRGGSGMTVAEAATKMGLSAQTVASYIKIIYQKLHINTRAEATHEAIRRGLA